MFATKQSHTTTGVFAVLNHAKMQTKNRASGAILLPNELIANYQKRRASLDTEIDAELEQICEILEIKEG